MDEESGESKEEVVATGTGVRNRETGMRSTKSHRELIQEKR